jgi:hypothetical protein
MPHLARCMLLSIRQLKGKAQERTEATRGGREETMDATTKEILEGLRRIINESHDDKLIAEAWRQCEKLGYAR